MVGNKYGRLTVVSQYFEKDGSGVQRDYCDCVCECGGEKNHVLGKNIRREMTVSCGCYHQERVYEACRLTNTYEQIDEFTIIGRDSQNREFLFSPEDYNRVKEYYWYVDNNGYAFTKTVYLTAFLHGFIMDSFEKRTVDHINRIRNDNRRENLRIVTIQQNNVNKGISTNNTSGIIGVSEVTPNRWHSYVTNPTTRKRINIYSKSFDDAVRQRLLLEKEYYGEFAPQKHLFEEYGV